MADESCENGQAQGEIADHVGNADGGQQGGTSQEDQAVGVVTSPTADGDAAPSSRARAHARWEQVRRLCRAEGETRRGAKARANAVVAEEFPELAGDYPAPAVLPEEEPPEPPEPDAEGPPEIDLPATAAAESGVIGLAAIPAEWPPLPPNASLAAEIQWVQSSRLDVVEELPGGAVRVHLDRADRPAPSKAAIGWLETSIRAYSKYCDIAAKATSQAEDEREHVRREKQAIEDVRSMLSEMLDAE